VPARRKPRPSITPLKAGIGIIIIIVLWLGIRISVEIFENSPYRGLFLLFILGFGFMIITFMIKYS
jgi:hypothetical protein